MFHTGGAPGIHPSKLFPRKVFATFPLRIHPLTVPPAVVPNAVATDRPGRPRFLGVDPCESPRWPDVGLAHRPRQAPLGFALLGFASKGLDRDSARSPLTRSPTAATNRPAAAPQSIDRPMPSPTISPQRTAITGGTTLLGFLHRLGPGHSSERPTWLWVHLVPRCTLLPTGRHSSNGLLRSTGAVGIG